MSKEHVAGGWAEMVSDRVGRSRGEHERARGRDIREEIDYRALDRLVGDLGKRQYGQEDQALAAIYETQGYHGKPEVVSEAELDARIARGWIEVWRGFGGPPEGIEYAEAFRSGDRHYAGLGVHGNGTYTAFGSDAEYQAGTYTHKVPGSMLEPNRGSLVRMAIPPEANLVNMLDMAHVPEVRGDYSISDPIRAARGRVFSDDGRLAAAMGYDGMALEQGGRGVYVIFNRSILAVQEAPRVGGEWEEVTSGGELVYWRRKLPNRHWIAVQQVGRRWRWTYHSRVRVADQTGYAASAEAAQQAADRYVAGRP